MHDNDDEEENEEITEMEKRFNKFDEEYLKFDRVENPPSLRPDLCAFLMLDKLFPSKWDIVDSSNHDEIWLSITSGQIESLTDDQIVYLLRCGVSYDTNQDLLRMFT